MRTYYRGPDVLITHEAFVRHTAPEQTFLIRELHHVVLVRGDLDPARTTSAHVAGGAAILVMAGWPLLDSPAAYAAAVLLVAVPSAAGVAYRRMRPRAWELRGWHEGREVILFASADIQTFNQVGHALRRAIEDHGPSASSYGLASR
jgi:hypothetical protein